MAGNIGISIHIIMKMWCAETIAVNVRITFSVIIMIIIIINIIITTIAITSPHHHHPKTDNPQSRAPHQSRCSHLRVAKLHAIKKQNMLIMLHFCHSQTCIQRTDSTNAFTKQFSAIIL